MRSCCNAGWAGYDFTLVVHQIGFDFVGGGGQGGTQIIAIILARGSACAFAVKPRPMKLSTVHEPKPECLDVIWESGPQSHVKSFKF